MGTRSGVRAAEYDEGIDRLRAAEIVPIDRIAAGGTARVVGRLSYVRRPVLTAPISGRECAGFRVVVEQLLPLGALMPRWTVVIDDTRHREFMVGDESGVVLVRPGASMLLLMNDCDHVGPPDAEPVPSVEAYLARHGRSQVAENGMRIWTRCHEGVIEADETVAVLGRVDLEPDPDLRAPGGGYRDRAMRPVLVPMVISDEAKALR